MMPIWLPIEIVEPEAHNASSAPTIASGTDIMSVNGCSRLSNCEARPMKMKMKATTMASPIADAVTPLAQFHRQRGLKVAVLDADDVYDQFNHGIAHPRAIRDLLQQAYREWPQPPPRLAPLVGPASFDTRHQPRPPRLMAGAEPTAGVGVEVLVEQY